MTNRDALLAAIADWPEDDTPRLVYADYLDEAGHPKDMARAKLIRAQVAAHRLPAGAGEKAELDKVVKGLWETHKSAWFPGISSAKLPYPERGFITSWGCYSAGEIAEADVPFTSEPISELTLSTDSSEELAGAEQWDGLRRVRELKVWPGKTDDEGMVRLLSSPHLTGLRYLWIMGNWAQPWSAMPDALRVLATRPQFSSLRELTIEHADVGNDGLVTLANTPTLRGLTTLSLGPCNAGLVGLQRLLASPVLSTVTHLRLAGGAHTEAEGEALAASLAGSRHLAQLASLRLDGSAFSDPSAARLARASWPALRRLALLPNYQNHADEETGLPTLTGAGVGWLVAAPWAAGLESLELSGHPFGDAGVVALARGKRLQRLRRLTLVSNGFTAAGLRELTDAYSQQLDLFQIAGNPIGDAGAGAIADAAWPRMLPLSPGEEFEQRGIMLGGCGVSEAGVKALLKSTTIPRETPDLFIGDAPVSAAVVARLKARYPAATIRF